MVLLTQACLFHLLIILPFFICQKKRDTRSRPDLGEIYPPTTTSYPHPARSTTPDQVTILTTFYKQLFVYESVFWSFSLITVWICNFFGKRILVQKLLVKYWCNWLQVIILQTFYKQLFVRKCFVKLLCTCSLGL